MRIHHLLIACMVATPVAAQAGWYAGPALLAGYTNENSIDDTSGNATAIFDDNDGNLIVGASGLLGYDFSDSDVPFSLEFSTNWQARHDLDIGYIDGAQQGVKSNVQTLDFMMSALYDIPLGTQIQPYIGAGAGLIYADTESEHLAGATMTDIGNETTTNFAWQLQGGIKYPLDETMKLRVDYRYIDMGEVSTPTAPNGSQFDADLYSHDVRMGVTWDF